VEVRFGSLISGKRTLRATLSKFVASQRREPMIVLRFNINCHLAENNHADEKINELTQTINSYLQRIIFYFATET
jgi:hypothetical protein